MTYAINETHDPGLTSWVASASEPGTDFPIQNLPFGVFRRLGSDEPPRPGVAIGKCILNLARCRQEGLLDGQGAETAAACEAPSLNALMALGSERWSALRRRLSELFRVDCPELQANRKLAHHLIVPMAEAELRLPAQIDDFSDFYASSFHASNVGSMFRPDNPLLPNYKYVPIAYHGRASSVVVSGTPVRRPSGQTQDEASQKPSFGPSKLLDYEAEVGFFVGPGNRLGEPIRIQDAEASIFGFCLVNDWSARDIQKWEYQPLGPFLAKSFATTVSAWVVTLEALEPFRRPAFRRPAGDPEPLPYLKFAQDRERGGLALSLEVFLSTQKMREEGLVPVRLSRGDFGDMYWTAAQMLTHHASNGCNLRPGDLLASGTVSGAAKESRGCLLELTWRGAEPIPLPTGELRRFLADGDEVILRGFCERPGFARLGFGECHGVVLAAVSEAES